LLLEMLWLAFHWRDEPTAGDGWPDPAAPHRYVEGFGRPGDTGVVAEHGGTLVGAAWYRWLPASDRGYGYVGDDVPELSLAVADGYRGRGVATGLLKRLVREAKDSGVTALSLSVEPDNPALRLYQRHGFNQVGEVGGSWTMVRPLDRRPHD
jgi:ribosomal protein S18 acetylase RimI-like enzyme